MMSNSFAIKLSRVIETNVPSCPSICSISRPLQPLKTPLHSENISDIISLLTRQSYGLPSFSAALRNTLSGTALIAMSAIASGTGIEISVSFVFIVIFISLFSLLPFLVAYRNAELRSV